MLALVILGCSAGSDPSATGDTTTYAEDIAPVVTSTCASCHVPGGLTPFPLETQADVYANKDAVVDAVTAGRMPPWGMERSCRETLGDLQLPDYQIQAFQAWKDAGFPVGEAPPTTTGAPPSADGEPASLELYPDAPYTPDATLGDDYRCRLLDQDFPETTWVSTTDALVDQVAEVHHIIAYAVPADQLDEAAALDAEDEAPGWACFGGPGVDASVIAGWAPGAQRKDPVTVDGQTAAIRVPAGSKILLEVHYNTTAVAETTPDLTGLALWTLPPGTEPDWLLWALAIADLGLDVPAGDAASVQGLTTRVAVDGRIVGASPHMHLRGTSLSAEVIRADGSEECLSDIPDWDFNWQRQYQYLPGEQVPLDVTDQVKLTCTYDNSAANQPPGETPAELWWGESTSDEMCLDYLSMATRWTGGDDPGVCAGFSDCYANCAPDDGFCFMTCAANSGEGCQNCSYDALFGECVTADDQCLAAGTGLYFCTLGCSDLDSDYAECLYDQCRDEFDAYYACFQPVFQAGTCASDYATCSGMSAP